MAEYWTGGFGPRSKGLSRTTARARSVVRQTRISPDFANLTGEQLQKIQDLEGELEVILTAHEKLPVLSDLSREEPRIPPGDGKGDGDHPSLFRT